MKTDFEQLQIDLQPEGNYAAFMKSMKASKEVNALVKKYGYKDANDFIVKIWSITAAFANIKIGDEGAPEMQKAMDKIDKDKSMTPEQKKQAKEQVRQLMEAMNSTFASQVNKQDVETVRPYVTKLGKLFDKE